MVERINQILGTDSQVQSVLIVDDDAGMCETLSDILEVKGFAVDTAQDGRMALQMLRQGDYHLILIDIMMPGMNGVETLQQIKAINPDILTLIMTGNSQLEGFVSDALWTGVDGVLYKPFEIDDVIELIERKSEEPPDTPIVDLRLDDIEPKAVALVPEEMARKYNLIPLRIEENHLVVAMADPTNLYAIEDLRVRTSLSITPVRAALSDIERAFGHYYDQTLELERQIEGITSLSDTGEADRSAERLSADQVSHTPIARSVQLMVQQAVRDHASDIHIEPQEAHLRIRYRIDGVLHDAMTLPLRVHAPLLSRIKVLSNLNIAERRRPQDGQFSVTLGDTSVDIRVATINSVHGEMAVLRVLDKSVSVLGFSELGFASDMQEQYERLLHAPWGIILVAGPTGSGKTSTLYASLNQMDRDESKIITIEDPVEYRFGGISQVQVNRQAGIDFASGLRAAMRLDPDVILVGEIRDQETARTAVQASLTGHLVFSTIHANDCVGTILRLVDLGVEPFLVTSSLLAVISQRLVRRVCPRCAELREVTSAERAAYEQVMGEERREFQYGAGCAHCAGTGYRGRVAVFELLTLDDDIRRLVLHNATSDEVQQKALEGGMRTMLQDGMAKVQQGVTTPTEVLKKVFALH